MGNIPTGLHHAKRFLVHLLVHTANILISLLFLRDVNLFVLLTGEKPHVTCERTFNKIGCFEAKSLVTTLLISDRDDIPEKSQGHVITWGEIDKYLHR